MRDSPHFLERLGLDGEADARAIRRAYARELKLIDPDQDLAGFQQLRQCYDIALRWAERRAAGDQDNERHVQISVAQETGAPADAAPSPDLHADAAAIFDRFRAGAKLNVDDWQTALDDALRDPVLFSFAARTDFETRIASLLADGWQPGHEHLLPIAIAAFHWDTERSRLVSLGAGWALDRAIDELHMFRHMSEPDNMSQDHIVRQLRSGKLPPSAKLRLDMLHLERAAIRYPCLLPMIAPAAAIQAWREAYAGLPDAPPIEPFPDPPPADPQPTRDSSWGWGRIIWIVLWVSFISLRHCATDNTPPPPTQTFPRVQPQSPAPYAPLAAAALRQRVIDKIQFKPAKSTVVAGKTVYQVDLTEDNQISILLQWSSSGDTRFDGAVSRAIRAAAPYPAGTPKSFQLEIGWDSQGGIR